jgi:hypothetical protein
LKKPKKILSILIKVLIGLGSFGIIYYRLRSEFTRENLNMLYYAAASYTGLASLLLCLLLIPVNWGIEAYKWMLITAPIEKVSYRTATKSVYSGVCLGNLAPGRATEFVAKILFFHIRNRPQVTVLHFVNGMFQLAVTVIAGFAAIMFHLKSFGKDSSWMLYTTSAIGIVLIVLLAVCIYKIDFLLEKIARKLSKENDPSHFKLSKENDPSHFRYKFTGASVTRLFGLSVLRYLVFFLQFTMLLYMFNGAGLTAPVFSGIALYFLVTTTIPMISVLEAAIRTAVALVVFKDTGISNTVLALSSIMIWLVNIIIPSIPGYYFLVRENFNFKLFRARR